MTGSSKYFCDKNMAKYTAKLFSKKKQQKTT